MKQSYQKYIDDINITRVSLNKALYFFNWQLSIIEYPIAEIKQFKDNLNGLVQNCCIPITDKLEIPQFCHHPYLTIVFFLCC